MNHQQILEKAITEAIKGGYDGKLPVTSDSPSQQWHPYGLIFNHDFAKALWGNKPYHHIMVMGKKSKEPGYEGRRSVKSSPEYCNWQYHLQQMVVAYDPIAYLGDNS